MKALALLFAVALGVTATPGPARAEEPLEDLTPPVITVTPSAGAVDGWYAGNASVFIKATDPGAISSGVRSVFYTLSGATTGTGTVHRTDGGTVAIANSGITTITIEATDGNDNQAFAAPVVRIDRDRPSAAFSGRMADADPTFAQGEQVLLQFGCTDGQSGIATCSGTQSAGAWLDTTTLGARTVTITARDKVGNQTLVSRDYQVVSNQFAVTRWVDVVGPKVVGSQVTAQTPVFEPVPTAVAYQWTRNGVAIAGATGTTYTLTPDDASTTIRLQATATRSGWQDRTVVSPGYQVSPATIGISSPPVLTGETRVGGSLFIEHGAVTPAAAALSYQWFRDGVLVPEASGRVYFPDAPDIGKRITARVAATAPGHAESVWLTSQSDPVQGRTLEVIGVPTVSGPLTAGAQLIAQAPVVRVPFPSRSGEPAVIAHQWLRDGTPIAGATASTYRLTPADVGHRVTVRLTATRPPEEGYEPVVLVSTPGPAVGQATPALTAKAKAKRDRKVKLTIAVSAAGLDPSAPVTVTRGGKVVARGSVTPSGRLVLTLKRQPKGKVTWTVTYAGSLGVATGTVKVTAKVR
jgi:hypothetical protein